MRNQLIQRVVMVSLGTASLTALTGCPSSDEPVKSGPHSGPISRDDPYGVPRDAKVVLEQNGELRYTVPADGKIYLLDVRSEKVMDSRNIRRGQEYVVNPKDQKVWVDNERVADPALDKNHTYRVLFADPKQDRDHYDTRDDRRGDRRDDDRAAKNGLPTSGVPDTAKLVKEGRRDDLSWVATDNGTVYLYDATGSKLIEMFNVRRGQRLTVSPSNGVASLEGNEVMRRPMGTKSTYRLLFTNN